MPNLTHFTITNNTSSASGGGIYSYSNSVLNMTNSLVKGNLSNNQGGGIQNEDNCSLFLTNVQVDSNTAIYGGGLSNRAFYSIKESVFSFNTASQEGGGIYSSGGDQIDTPDTLYHSIIRNNLSNGNGGGLSIKNNQQIYFD